MLSEQTHGRVALGIHHVHEWVSILQYIQHIYVKIKISYGWSINYLRQTGCKDAHFEVFGHLLQEVLGTWPFHHVDVRNSAFNIHRNRVVRLAYEVELTVHQGFIEVENERFQAVEALRLGT